MTERPSAAAVRTWLAGQGVPLLPVEDNAKLPMKWMRVPNPTLGETCMYLKIALEMRNGVSPAFKSNTSQYGAKLALGDAVDDGQQYRVVLVRKADA